MVRFRRDRLPHDVLPRSFTYPCERWGLLFYLRLSGLGGSHRSRRERELVARSCLVRAEEMLRLSHRIRHQLLSWSYGASTETHVRSALICSNAFCCSVPHVHWFPLQRRSLMLFVLSARCSENLLNWFTMPRNVLYDSCTFCGGGRSAIACSLWRSASIPRELMTCPRNLTLPVQHRQS